MVIPARGNKRGLTAIARGQFEAERAGVEREAALKIGDLEVNVADAGGGVDTYL
jgi:hypothetical protein